MAVAEPIRTRRVLLGPASAGVPLTPRQFDQADYEEGWRYELINGVLVVSPLPLNAEVDPNEELGRLLRNYQEGHPQGNALDMTLPERQIITRKNRRRADRLIWAGLGRLPRPDEKPTVAVEWVSKGKRSHERDYEEKRREYQELRIAEYWRFNRFERTLTVFVLVGGRYRKRVFEEHDTYRTPLLPGFEVPIARLLRLANRWKDDRND
jgi:Uma2 family endonuclease